MNFLSDWKGWCRPEIIQSASNNNTKTNKHVNTWIIFKIPCAHVPWHLCFYISFTPYKHAHVYLGFTNWGVDEHLQDYFLKTFFSHIYHLYFRYVIKAKTIGNYTTHNHSVFLQFWMGQLDTTTHACWNLWLQHLRFINRNLTNISVCKHSVFVNAGKQWHSLSIQICLLP